MTETKPIYDSGGGDAAIRLSPATLRRWAHVEYRDAMADLCGDVPEDEADMTLRACDTLLHELAVAVVALERVRSAVIVAEACEQ